MTRTKATRKFAGRSASKAVVIWERGQAASVVRPRPDQTPRLRNGFTGDVRHAALDTRVGVSLHGEVPGAGCQVRDRVAGRTGVGYLH